MERQRHVAEMVLRARALGLLFLAGATIGLTSLVLPVPRGADLAGLWSNVGLAYAGAAGLLLFAGRFRPWMLHVALITGSLLITRAVYLSGEAASFYAVWLLWVPLYAFYFFERAVGAGYVALCAGLYALTLANRVPSSPVARWLTTVATLIVAGVFIDTLVRRARREAANAQANAERMAKVARVAVHLASLSDPVAAREAVCAAAAELTGAIAVTLWEPSAERSEMRVTARSDRSERRRLAIPLARRDAGAVRAYASQQPTCSRTVPVTAESAPEFAAQSTSVSGCLWQPVTVEERVIAVLGLLWDEERVLDDPSMLTVCELIGAEVQVTLERVSLLARLESIARTDELTGLPNRRAWQEALPRELQRASRSKEPLCVAMLDLDHFKRYNDARGHQAGDRLLKEVAVGWNQELRGADILARYGGEEFAVALPACPLSRGIGVVERLRAAIPGEESCSAGIAVWDGSESAIKLVGRADEALYEAKRSGRNRTILSVGGTEPGMGTAGFEPATSGV